MQHQIVWICTSPASFKCVHFFPSLLQSTVSLLDDHNGLIPHRLWPLQVTLHTVVRMILICLCGYFEISFARSWVTCVSWLTALPASVCAMSFSYFITVPWHTPSSFSPLILLIGIGRCQRPNGLHVAMCSQICTFSVLRDTGCQCALQSGQQASVLTREPGHSESASHSIGCINFLLIRPKVP